MISAELMEARLSPQTTTRRRGGGCRRKSRRREVIRKLYDPRARVPCVTLIARDLRLEQMRIETPQDTLCVELWSPPLVSARWFAGMQILHRRGGRGGAKGGRGSYGRMELQIYDHQTNTFR